LLIFSIFRQENFNRKLIINHISERSKLIELHIIQAKRDELEARALLHDANIEFEKFQNQISAKISQMTESGKETVDATSSVAQGSDWIKKGNFQNLNTVFSLASLFLPSSLSSFLHISSLAYDFTEHA
jgi:hypothetical protein